MNIFEVISWIFLSLSIVTAFLGIGLKLKYKPWVILSVVAIITGVFAGILNPTALFYTGLFALVTFYYQKQNNSWLALIYFILAIPLFLHFKFTGFTNYKYLDQVKITTDAIPFSLYFNFDKTLIGLFVIGSIGFQVKKENALSYLKSILKYVFLMISLFTVIAMGIGFIKFDVKFPPFSFVWMFLNLFFVCTAEEILFREIAQKNLGSILKMKHSNTLAIIISSVLFGLLHFKSGSISIIFASIAGLFFAHIYFKTKNVRASIILHFLFNLIHFIFFTYPGLDH